MIQTKKELKRVLTIEKNIYGRKWYYFMPFMMTEKQILYRHICLLRKAEYAVNTSSLLRYWYLTRLLRIQTRYGISIPLNVMGEGAEIVHLGSIIINGNAKIGKYVRLHPGVCIGANHDNAPIIGDNVYIGPGAKLFGNIKLANCIKVGANAVVTKSCDKEGVVLVGAPAKVIGLEENN